MLHTHYSHKTLQWRHNGRDGVLNHQPHHCFLNRLFRRRSKKTSKLSVTGLCAGNSPGTGEFPAEMASNAETVSIWWRHHELAAMPLYFQGSIYVIIDVIEINDNSPTLNKYNQVSAEEYIRKCRLQNVMSCFYSQVWVYVFNGKSASIKMQLVSIKNFKLLI